jgi:hypothetical protein
MKWIDIPDEEKDPRLSMPSGLTKIRVPTYYGYERMDVTGTTNEQAFKKLLNLYSDPLMAKSLGDHIYFQELFLMKVGIYCIFWGS